jgi:hypothetical protein
MNDAMILFDRCSGTEKKILQFVDCHSPQNSVHFKKDESKREDVGLRSMALQVTGVVAESLRCSKESASHSRTSCGRVVSDLQAARGAEVSKIHRTVPVDDIGWFDVLMVDSLGMHVCQC